MIYFLFKSARVRAPSRSHEAGLLYVTKMSSHLPYAMTGRYFGQRLCSLLWMIYMNERHLKDIIKIQDQFATVLRSWSLHLVRAYDDVSWPCLQLVLEPHILGFDRSHPCMNQILYRNAISVIVEEKWRAQSHEIRSCMLQTEGRCQVLWNCDLISWTGDEQY